MVVTWGDVALFVASLIAACVMCRHDLHMLQQNSYYNSRYYRYLTGGDEMMSPQRLSLLAVWLLLLTTFAASAVLSPIAAVLLLGIAWWAHRRYAKSKDPLKFTKRARTIYFTTLTLIVAITAVLSWLVDCTTGLRAMVAMVVISPLMLLLANWLLAPYERYNRYRYAVAARRRLQSQPRTVVIGITGSYGKTSTKHFLTRLLSEHYSTLMTPGGYNTTAGVEITIEQHLKPYHEYFVCEMGAKKRGDVKEICDIVSPRLGIITAVGEMHLETFGSVENVQRTKFELADALPADGFLLVNNDFEKAASRVVTNVECKRYSVKPGDAIDYWAEDIRYSASGTDFVFCSRDGERLNLHTRLVGESNISNLIASVAMARHLGVPEDKIRYAMLQIEPIEHRLDIKRQGGVTMIDDAYNTNPIGARMALDVLASMTGGQRLVVTSGMIELGERQYELNRDLGEYIATHADAVIVIGEYNRAAILEGLKAGGMAQEAVHVVDSLQQAFAVRDTLLRDGDTWLLQPQLPDTFK